VLAGNFRTICSSGPWIQSMSDLVDRDIDTFVQLYIRNVLLSRRVSGLRSDPDHAVTETCMRRPALRASMR